LRPVVADAKAKQMTEFAAFRYDSLVDGVSTRDGDPAVDEGTWNEFLRHRLGSDTQAQERFVDALFEALDAYRRVHPYQPTWTASWHDLEPHLNEDSHRWLEIMGMVRITYPRWLLVLKYRARETGTLLRPTMLDAGWDSGGYHFPSPPELSPPHGGRTMDLGMAVTIPEYIHQEMSHTLRHWQDGGRRAKATSRAVMGDFLSQRRRHRQLLRKLYGSTTGWMPEAA
jgi:hypothetical protein